MCGSTCVGLHVLVCMCGSALCMCRSASVGPHVWVYMCGSTCVSIHDCVDLHVRVYNLHVMVYMLGRLVRVYMCGSTCQGLQSTCHGLLVRECEKRKSFKVDRVLKVGS